ncbi:hypothetical protein LCGC14_1515290 [marine sediment metagenome]|uniref:Uncharacterized protein n=1 Tax=marine sediment metagenome TaxID=412755 RepID=A0A0F9J0F5_9ZZZZ
MIKYLQDLWIILKEGGILIFSKSREVITHDQYLGGLVSAFFHFSEIALEESLIQFTTNKLQYKIITKRNILFVGGFKRSAKGKKSLRKLILIAEKFVELYPKKIIDQWDHNLNAFIGFNEILKPKSEIMGGYIESMWNHGSRA